MRSFLGVITAVFLLSPPRAFAEGRGSLSDPTHERPFTDDADLSGIYMRFSTFIPNDPAFDLVSDLGALVRFEIGGERSIAALVPGLSFQLGLAAGGQAASAFDAFDARFGLTSIQVAAVYRVPVWGVLELYGRAMGALELAHLSLSDRTERIEIDDVATGASATGTIGFEIALPVSYTPIRDATRGGEDGSIAGGGSRAERDVDQWLTLFLEAGYRISTPFGFDDLARDDARQTDPPRIASVSTNAGSLGTTGPTWGVGGAFHF